jgi:hypothetical protein
MFPPGLPGLALLLLRLSVAVALLLHDYTYRDALPVWVHVTVILISLVVSVGYLTPIAAAAALVYHMLVGIDLGTGADALVVTLVPAIDALALASVLVHIRSTRAATAGESWCCRPSHKGRALCPTATDDDVTGKCFARNQP